MGIGSIISKAILRTAAWVVPALILSAGTGQAANPIIKHKYTADPAAMA